MPVLQVATAFSLNAISPSGGGGGQATTNTGGKGGPGFQHLGAGGSGGGGPTSAPSAGVDRHWGAQAVRVLSWAVGAVVPLVVLGRATGPAGVGGQGDAAAAPAYGGGGGGGGAGTTAGLL